MLENEIKVIMQTDALEFKKVDNSFNKGEGNYKR